MGRMRINSLRKEIEKTQKGGKFHVNAIGLTTNAINELRRMIVEKEITPDRATTMKVYKDVEGVMSGEVILPQNWYKKN